MSELQETLKPQPLEGLKIQIVKENNEFETEPGVLSIPYNILRLSIKSKGKLDIYMVSYVAHLLNKAYKI